MKREQERPQVPSSQADGDGTRESAQAEAIQTPAVERSDSKAGKLLSMLDKFTVKEVRFGPLTAHFPEQASRSINIQTEPNCKLDFKGPLLPTDNVNIRAEEGTQINFDLSEARAGTPSGADGELRVIAPYQEDIASFELQTAHWLMFKPTT